MDEATVLAEIDLCADCRLCEELCQHTCKVFPAIYRLRDASASGKPVAFDSFLKAFSLCHYCKMCACEKLPWTIWTARIQHFEKHGMPWGSRIISNVDSLGRLASSVPRLSNALFMNGTFRTLMARGLKISKERKIPPFNSPSVTETLTPRRSHNTAQVHGETPKVAYFVGCSTNYNYTDIGLRTAALLRRNGVHVVCPPQVCCGMPQFAEGNMKGLMNRVKENLDSLTQVVRDGYDIVTSCPTCGLMIKELIKNEEFFGSPLAEKAERVAASTHDLGEYLLTLHRRNKLALDLQALPLTVAYYPPCHLKAQGNGLAFLELMKMIPGLRVVDIQGDYCCGIGGTFGLKEEKHRLTMATGRRLFEKIESIPSDLVVTECNGCRIQISEGTNKKVVHPVEILASASSLGA